MTVLCFIIVRVSGYMFFKPDFINFKNKPLNAAFTIIII